MATEDPRLKEPGLCRATTVLAGKEFICINPVHEDPPARNPLYYTLKEPFIPRSIQHGYIKRYIDG